MGNFISQEISRHSILSLPTVMANPRQRRKSRSSTTTKPSLNAKRAMKKKLVRAPTVKGADVLKDAWDGNLTARQNYAKLGLIPSLDVRPNSGGVEHKTSSLSQSIPTSTAVATEGSAGKGRKGMAKIVRDADGNIVDIIEAVNDNNDSNVTPWGAPLAGDPTAEESALLETYMPPARQLQRGEKPNKVITDLESLASEAAPVERYTSHIESDWLTQLVAKHGPDTEAMSKDPKLNPWQKTKGQISRAIKKAGGIDAVQSHPR